jgi:hypothetical protein
MLLLLIFIFKLLEVSSVFDYIDSNLEVLSIAIIFILLYIALVIIINIKY